MNLTDCPAGRHDSAEACDDDPYCPADDPACYGNRCSDHENCAVYAIPPEYRGAPASSGAKPTKHQSDPQHQGTCKFGESHLMAMPIFRDGRQVSPDTGPDDDDWAECSRCGRVEDELGRVVLAPGFARCTR